MSWLRNLDLVSVGLILMAVALAAVAATLVFSLLVGDPGRIDRFTEDCHRLGGHIYGDGLYLCVDDGGHLLEARA